MKKENPETLQFLVFVNHFCPVSKPEIEELVNGVLIRARLRPSHSLKSTPLAFIVALDCVKSGDDFFVYNIEIKFTRIAPARVQVEWRPSYGDTGIGSPANIKEGVRHGVENLVTDYLKANFDLTPE